MSKWIRCSESMPEVGVEVILYDARRRKVQSGMKFQEQFGPDFIFVDFSEEYYEVINPTHWQPLPEKPEE